MVKAILFILIWTPGISFAQFGIGLTPAQQCWSNNNFGSGPTFSPTTSQGRDNWGDVWGSNSSGNDGWASDDGNGNQNDDGALQGRIDSAKEKLKRILVDDAVIAIENHFRKRLGPSDYSTDCNDIGNPYKLSVPRSFCSQSGKNYWQGFVEKDGGIHSSICKDGNVDASDACVEGLQELSVAVAEQEAQSQGGFCEACTRGRSSSEGSGLGLLGQVVGKLIAKKFQSRRSTPPSMMPMPWPAAPMPGYYGSYNNQWNAMPSGFGASGFNCRGSSVMPWWQNQQMRPMFMPMPTNFGYAN